MILCVGPSGSGKTVLLRYLVAHEEFSAMVNSAKGGAANTAAVNNAGAAAFGKKNLTASIGTVGTNLVTLTKPKAKKDSNAAAESVVIREVGGSMAPLWHSYIEPGKQTIYAKRI